MINAFIQICRSLKEDVEHAYDYRAKILLGEVVHEKVPGVSETRVACQKFKNYLIDIKRRIKTRKQEFLDRNSDTKYSEFLFEIMESLNPNEKKLLLADLMYQYAMQQTRKNNEYVQDMELIESFNNFIPEELGFSCKSHSELYASMGSRNSIKKARMKLYKKIREKYPDFQEKLFTKPEYEGRDYDHNLNPYTFK